MKSFILATLLLVVPALAQAQGATPPRMNRPSFAQTGKETMPMMLVDEAALGSQRFTHLAYPMHLWEQEKTCLTRLGVKPRNIGAPPVILVIPAARTIRVHDMTVDSMAYAEDSTFMGEVWPKPTVAYALVRSNFILVTEEYQKNPYVLRHEALHFMLWRLKLAPLGHPKEFFEPCDVHYDPSLPSGWTPNNDWR